MARSGARVWLIILAVPILIVLGGIGYLAWRQSVAGVRVEFEPVPRYVGARTPITLVLRAARGGVQSVDIRLNQGGTRVNVSQQAFPAPAASEQRVQLVVQGGQLGLREGAANLEVRARDGFWRPIRVDDRMIANVPVTIDFTPPTLEVLASTRYLSRGGGALVAVRAKGAARVGVNVGDLFFPGFPAGAPDTGLHAVLYALPWNLPPNSPVTATAQDEAGNAVSRALAVDIRPRRFPLDTIEVGEQFLASKMPELLPERGQIPPDQLLQAFLVVNRDKRKEGEEMKRRLGQKSKPSPLFEGAFLQPRNTKVFSNFAETRTYRYKGQDVDTQVHLGYDLASLKNSPIPAANSGVVVYAAPLTIYGNTVVVDHGWGLQTLYGHLSSIDVKEGDEVKKGQSLGRSGATGLALGDHLHFEVLIQGVSVTPVEWWDGKWIRDHVGRPLREANIPLLQSDQPAAGAEEPAPAAPSPRRRRR
ncbi:MAG TPA: M23 family metallopeptidase [Methylomirabilota bacterium]|nr:M23 family metallopeptidase [Methylomirabilota bacterium]